MLLGSHPPASTTVTIRGSTLVGRRAPRRRGLVQTQHEAVTKRVLHSPESPSPSPPGWEPHRALLPSRVATLSAHAEPSQWSHTCTTQPWAWRRRGRPDTRSRRALRKNFEGGQPGRRATRPGGPAWHRTRPVFTVCTLKQFKKAAPRVWGGGGCSSGQQEAASMWPGPSEPVSRNESQRREGAAHGSAFGPRRPTRDQRTDHRPRWPVVSAASSPRTLQRRGGAALAPRARPLEGASRTIVDLAVMGDAIKVPNTHVGSFRRMVEERQHTGTHTATHTQARRDGWRGPGRGTR
jgi:hypothetical protein